MINSIIEKIMIDNFKYFVSPEVYPYHCILFDTKGKLAGGYNKKTDKFATLLFKI